VKIESILFDMGKVILDFNFETGVQALHAACSISRDRLEEVLWDENCIRRYERGEISTRDFHAYLCETADLKLDLAGFCRTWSSVFLPDLIVSEDLLRVLKQKYPLILVSNTNEVHIDFIRANYGFLDFFDHHVLSYEVGSLKPEREIFEQAIAVAGYPPEALFFTDDREENIVAANELGMRAHQFRSQAQLVNALQRVGVEICSS
jgi:putative hydrolase of the HAD superfamily